MKRRNRKSANFILAENLKYLTEREGITGRALAKKCDIADKTVGNIINARNSPTIETVDKIAAFFGLELWQLTLPDLPLQLEGIKSLDALAHLYSEANNEGRRHILMVAEREAKYATSNQAESTI